MAAALKRHGHGHAQAVAAMGLASLGTLRNYLHDRSTPNWANAPKVLDYLRSGGGDKEPPA
jgi:hypothetical protein